MVWLFYWAMLFRVWEVDEKLGECCNTSLDYHLTVVCMFLLLRYKKEGWNLVKASEKGCFWIRFGRLVFYIIIICLFFVSNSWENKPVSVNIKLFLHLLVVYTTSSPPGFWNVCNIFIYDVRLMFLLSLLSV